MFDLIRGAAQLLAAFLGSAIDAQTGSVLVLLSLSLLIAAAVISTRRSAPIAVAPGVQQVLASRARGVVIRPARSAPTLRRRHRARAPGRAA